MTKKIKKVTTTVTEEIIESNEKTHIIAILDTSGSMSSIIFESINAFNGFLKTQRNLSDECTITINLFDDQFETIVENVNINDVKDVSNNQWVPRGLTALYDAIGKSIANAKTKFTKLGNDKPDKVLVCIVTDGQENASKEYKSDTIKKLIKNCEDENWNFMYLASGQDAFAVGSQFGMSFGNSYTYTADSAGANNVFATMSMSATNYRSMSSTDADFKRKSKKLIDNDEKDLNNEGTITVSDGTVTLGTTNIDTSRSDTTYVVSSGTGVTVK